MLEHVAVGELLEPRAIELDPLLDHEPLQRADGLVPDEPVRLGLDVLEELLGHVPCPESSQGAGQVDAQAALPRAIAQRAPQGAHRRGAQGRQGTPEGLAAITKRQARDRDRG